MGPTSARNRVVVIEKHASYTKYPNDPGHLLEQFVKQSKQDQSSTNTTYEHLQTMRIDGQHTVLISAESDGIENTNDNNTHSAIEIKCSNPQHWNMKLPFQMISNGSHTLVYAEKEQKKQQPSSSGRRSTGSSGKQQQGLTTITHVHTKSLDEVLHFVQNKTTNAPAHGNKGPPSVPQLEERLAQNLRVLADARNEGLFDDGRPYTLQFVERQLQLHPVSILPTEAVVHELLSSSRSGAASL